MKQKPAAQRPVEFIQQPKFLRKFPLMGSASRQPKNGTSAVTGQSGQKRATILQSTASQNSGRNVRHFFHSSSFKIVIRKVEPPFSGKPIDELDWICQSLGFFGPFEKENPASQVFREIIKATESGTSVTSTGLAERVSLSRGAVIHHLNSLMRSGLIVKNGRFYVSRSRSIYRTIEEIEGDIERIFSRMKRTALEIDEELGVVQHEKQ